MSDSEELARKERRRRLIERLDEKEQLIGPKSPTARSQMSEEELAAEIEKQRVLINRFYVAMSTVPGRW